MRELNQKIQELLGASAIPPDKNSGDYHAAFERSGIEKATDILRILSTYGADLSRLAYLSVGGSSGAEVLHALRSSPVQYGVLLEYDDLAANRARESALQVPLKQLKIVCGDATAKITDCRVHLEELRTRGAIDGVICSFQAVLHELPTRSPNYEPSHLLGEAIWDWTPLYLFCREPCSPQGWPDQVRLSVSDANSTYLEALARNVAGMLSITSQIRRAGATAILVQRDLAVEILFKLFYLQDYTYEIQERLTSIQPDALYRTIESLLPSGHVERQYLNTESFNRLYREFGVEAIDPQSGQRLTPPLVFVQIRARREQTRQPPEVGRRHEPLLDNHVRITAAISEQTERVLNVPLLPWSPRSSPSLRVLWPDLLIDPKLRAHREPAQPRRLTEWFAEFSSKADIAIVGAPGAGKTTALRRLFLSASDQIDRNGTAFPVFGHITDYGSEDISGVRPIDTALRTARSTGRTVVHFIDGFDEVDVVVAEKFLSRFRATFPADEHIWAACRSEFYFNRLLSGSNPVFRFRETLELLPWDPPQARSFVADYCRRTKLEDMLGRYDTLLNESPQLEAFVCNPFHLTLLLYLLGGEKDLDGQQIKNAYALYDHFYGHWLRREVHRGTSKGRSDSVRRLHTAIAEELFDSRGSIGRRGVAIDDRMRAVIPGDSAVSDLLRLNSDQTRIVAFRHETLGEYLLAAKVLSALIEEASPLEDVLLRTYTFETNAFVREGLALLSATERDALVRLLTTRYRQHCGSEDASHLRIREQLLYYIGRIPCSGVPSVLTVAYREETHPLLSRIAALGALLHGDDDIERDYLTRLTAGSSWDIENRSVQLLYFGDARGDFYSFRDDGSLPWDRTRTAILDRLSAPATYRNERLRWWDLRTLRLFLVSRGQALSSKEGTIVLNAMTGVERSGDGRSAAIRSEIDSLVGMPASGHQ